MKKLCALILLVISTALSAQPNQLRGIRVYLETDTWNQSMLLGKLNDNGKRKHLKFIALTCDNPCEYKITYENAIKPVQSYYGEMALHATSVTCYDSSGKTLFTFTR